MLKAMIGAVSLSVSLLASTAIVHAKTVITVLHEETNPATVGLWTHIAADYEKAHSDVVVKFQYLENEAYKAKLPTMLQSSDRPDIIWSWAGGVMRAQIDAGYLRPLGAPALAVLPHMVPADAAAYDVGGKYYGLPILTDDVCFFYNKKLFARAGVDADQIKTWGDLLAAVKKLKAAGVTPIAVGAGEKWPMQFYWAYLTMREGGGDIIAQAQAGRNGGFAGPAFVAAGERLQELAKLQPFQPGYVGTLALQADGMFGDGNAAMELMGNWLLGTQAGNAADGKGLATSDIGVFQFPTIPSTPGLATDQLGGVNGWLVTKSAPPAADDFLAFFYQPKYQQQAAASGIYIPAVAGTSAAISNPLVQKIAGWLDHASTVQIFFDQALGPSVGRVVNDASVAVAAGQMTPKAAAQSVQQAWDDEQQ